jgi:hypothetical protein
MPTGAIVLGNLDGLTPRRKAKLTAIAACT